MFVRAIREKLNQNTTLVCYCTCDTCGVELKRSKKALKAKFHFCDKKCANAARQKDGVLDVAKRERCKELYGAEYVFQSKHFRDEYKKTSLKNFGTEHPMSAMEITWGFIEEQTRKKAQDTCLENHGVKHFAQSQSIKNFVEYT